MQIEFCSDCTEEELIRSTAWIVLIAVTKEEQHIVGGTLLVLSENVKN